MLLGHMSSCGKSDSDQWPISGHFCQYLKEFINKAMGKKKKISGYDVVQILEQKVSWISSGSTLIILSNHPFQQCLSIKRQKQKLL